MTDPSSPLSVLAPAGPIAGLLTEVAWVLIGGAAVVFVIVMALLAGVVWRRRGAAPPGPEEALVRRWIVWGGLVFPATVLMALLAYAGLRAGPLNLKLAAGTEPIIGVSARLWWWEVRYRDPSAHADFALANEIRIPVGRPVTIGLTSTEVIHSLWVPALAGKVDMVPGRVHQLRLEASRAGTFRGVCAEFCGDQHAKMAFLVVAMDEPDYAAWLQAQAAPAQRPAEPLAVRGWEVFQVQRCGACHTVRGLGHALIDPPPGPDLTHYASRSQLAAGTLPRDPAHTRRWIEMNQQIKPGARMPEYGHLDPAALDALAAFLESLR